ncbi:HAD family phosphatase [Robiginitalea sp. M366]|uniref:HAD family hydrolase n=1 Tax=Robiginitalea aestuariiviva TaxID=3036903 RepID=UPI00240D1B07|nr:HAD family phosphatase [Robiginitalea aestuariiviva]MDG1573146.1 HAD family phosphatase [Robiginitalea aestuariiviva]
MSKAIIFDFGGVLINLDFEAVPRALREWGADPSDAFLQQLSRQYETGQIPTAGFLETASGRLGGVSGATLAEAWNAMILDLPESRVEFLENLRDGGGYRLFLLSNTNALHMARVRERLGGPAYQRFTACFEGFYLSHEIGLRKPDPEIFRWVTGRHGLTPGDTLFIDDTAEHILGAQAIGLQTWHFQPGRDKITELLTRS